MKKTNIKNGYCLIIPILKRWSNRNMIITWWVGCAGIKLEIENCILILERICFNIIWNIKKLW